MSVPWLDLPSIARVPEGQLPSKAEFLQLLCHCWGGIFLAFKVGFFYSHKLDIGLKFTLYYNLYLCHKDIEHLL